MLLVVSWLGSILGATQPTPPSTLVPWVEYAREVVDRGPACPPGLACVQLSRVEVQGQAERGEVTLIVEGENLGREESVVPLLEPASTFAVVDARWRQGQGVVALAGSTWTARARPGAFVLELALRFSPAPSVPLRLPSPVANIVDRLQSGGVAFDDSSDRHGGVLFLQSQSRGPREEEEISVRVTRALRWGGVVTFTYHYAVSGLREQKRLQLTRLGGEILEAVAPEIPYTLSETGIEVTLSPGNTTLEVTGHFPQVPTALTKPGGAPFEYWLFDTDPRHPVQLATDGVEIDPGEVSGIAPTARSRAFFLVERQKLEVTPLEVQVDKGRQGAGTAAIEYQQGPDGFWVGNIVLQSTTAPESDRILIPTPTTPHYAESGGEAVRMFSDAETLSLRVEARGDSLAPIRVQWREAVGGNAFLALPRFRIPGQSLHLDEEEVVVKLMPGYVPMMVVGAAHASGHLVDGLHIYAILIALLGVAFARAARFPIWAMVIAAVLLAGLYAVEGFPRVALLVLLGGCAVLVQLPQRALAALQAHRVLHSLLGLAWVTVLLITLIPAVIYITDRVYTALHPWSADDLTTMTGEVLGLPGGQGGRGDDGYVADEPAATAPEEQGVRAPEEALAKDGKLASSWDRSLLASQQAAPPPRKAPKATEKTIRPVAFDLPVLPARVLRFGFGSLLPGEAATATVLLAGPWLRGAWMFAECAGFAAVLALLIMRARRFWVRDAEVKS